MVSADGCDAHTGAYVWGNGTYPLDSMPLRLWLFDEGVYIVDALPPGIGRLEVIPGVGHFPWKDAPDRYWPVIEDFVAR